MIWLIETLKRHCLRDPSMQIIPTLGPEVYEYYLLWAIRIPRLVTVGAYLRGLLRFGVEGVSSIGGRLSTLQQ